MEPRARKGAGIKFDTEINGGVRNITRRPTFRLGDVQDADFARVRVLSGARAFALDRVTSFRDIGSVGMKDSRLDGPVTGNF
jgi:hypothetical protein